MSKKRYQYSHGGSHRVGLMICAHCQQSIGAEEFRYYETEERFVAHHRKCCEDDSAWKRIDNEAAKFKEQCRQRLAAFKAFRDQWNWSSDDFDNEIILLHDLVGDD